MLTFTLISSGYDLMRLGYVCTLNFHLKVMTYVSCILCEVRIFIFILFISIFGVFGFILLVSSFSLLNLILFFVIQIRSLGLMQS